MPYSQLYTGIRFAFFGVVTVSGLSLLATTSTSIYAADSVNTVSNIRQFDYTNKVIISPNKVIIKPIVTPVNQKTAQPVTGLVNNNSKSNQKNSASTTDYISAYLSTNLSANLSTKPTKKPNASNTLINQPILTQESQVRVNEISKKSTITKKIEDYIKEQAIDKSIQKKQLITNQMTSNRITNNISINTKTINTINTQKSIQSPSPATHSNIKALYEQVQNKKNTVDNQANIQKWAYKSRNTIQDSQSVSPDNTLKSSAIDSSKNALTRYSASLTGVLKKPVNPIYQMYNQASQSDNQLKNSLTNTVNSVNTDTDDVNNAESFYQNQEEMQDQIRKQVIEQQEKLKQLYQQPDLSHNISQYSSITSPYQLSQSLQFELNNADLLANQDTSSLRKTAYINSLNEGNSSSSISSNNTGISSLASQDQLTGVYAGRTDYTTDIDMSAVNTTSITGTDTGTVATKKKIKKQQLINKLIDSAYQTNNESNKQTSHASNEQIDRCYGQWVYPSTKQNNENDSEPQSQLPESTSKGWYHAIADYGYYDNQRYAELTGNVLIRQGKQLIKADKVTLDLENRTAKAEGEVMFNEPNTNNDKAENALNNKALKNDSLSIIGVADTIQYGENINAEAINVAFASIPMQAHGYARKLIQKSDNKYNLQDVMFTTCDPITRKWHLESKSIDLNQETGRGETQSTTFHIKDVPVFYLPYFNFPIDSRRASGFLLPNVDFNFETGPELSIPYYFNLAPNYDATVSTDIFSNRNPMLTGEFRYLTGQFGSGRVMGSYLPNDRSYDNQTRNSLYFQHDWQSEKMPNLTAELQYNYVSDADYDDEFDYLGVVDNYLNLPHSAKLNYSNDYLNLQLKAEDYQSLEATDIYGNRIEDKDRPYARLPRLTIDYRLPLTSKIQSDTKANKNSNSLLKSLKNSKLEITGEHDSAYFKNSIEDGSSVEQSGFRMYNKLSASYPYIRPWGYIEPQLNLQHLYASYDKEARIANNISEQNNKQSAFVPQITIDTVANFEKQGAPFKNTKYNNRNGYQMLSPRLKYSYAPYRSQNNIPNFNTRIASINYEQLYADSWFLGHDRLQDLHTLTPGVNYRYINEMGLTRFDVNIAQQFYLDSGQVTLNNNEMDNSDRTEQNSLFNEKSSGLVSSISAQPYPNLWLDLDGALKNDYQLNYITSQLRYKPSTDSQFSLGITERKQDNNTNQLPISAVTASAIFPINDNWRMVSQTQYDYDENKFLDSLIGVDYEDCCFGFSLYAKRSYNDFNLNEPPDPKFMGKIRFKGLMGAGSPSKLLSQKIMGFDSVNNSWKQ